LYELIWMRTVASQMKDAVGESVQVRLGATATSGKEALFGASGKIISFPGFLRAYVEGSDDPDADLDDQERRLPPMEVADPLAAESLEAKGHETQPPRRYTEASLVRRLEELGIGRPSTYASIISTIVDRGYARKKGTTLIPTFLAFATVGLLEDYFESLVDYEFTARMEDDLDGIANGREQPVPWLSRFYFGNGQPGLHDLVSTQLEEIDPRAVNSIPLGEDSDGVEIVARVGRYGPYLQRGDDTGSIPDDLAPDELTIERAVEILEAPSGDRVLGEDPETGLDVIARTGRFGPYVQLGEAGTDGPKPKTASLFKMMSLDTISLDEALRLLTQPRIVGKDPADGIEITAQNGRYGPYLKKGKETRSLETEEQIFTISVDEALTVLAQPRTRGRAAQAVLRELGEDPVSGQPVVLKEGRWGPYVTDGDVNASLRSGDDPESVTIERASDLLAERREKGPAKKRGGGRKKSGAGS
jgi:DNA topoisomerase-1